MNAAEIRSMLTVTPTADIYLSTHGLKSRLSREVPFDDDDETGRLRYTIAIAARSVSAPAIVTADDERLSSVAQAIGLHICPSYLGDIGSTWRAFFLLLAVDGDNSPLDNAMKSKIDKGAVSLGNRIMAEILGARHVTCIRDRKTCTTVLTIMTMADNDDEFIFDYTRSCVERSANTTSDPEDGGQIVPEIPYDAARDACIGYAERFLKKIISAIQM